jgi:hypothetical protein
MMNIEGLTVGTVAGLIATGVFVSMCSFAAVLRILSNLTLYSSFSDPYDISTHFD